jgi:hypothetical protein
MLWLAPAGLLSQGSEGAVKVTSEPSGAQVWIDDVHRGSTPLLVELPTGRHALRVEQAGYRPVIRYIQLAADRLAKQHVQLEADPGSRPGTAPPARKKPEPPAAAKVRRLDDAGADASPGTVSIATTPPGLHVFMNEELILQPTPVIFDIRPGIYELRIEDRGETVYRRTIFVRSGISTDLDLVIRRSRAIDYSDPWQ